MRFNHLINTKFLIFPLFFLFFFSHLLFTSCTSKKKSKEQPAAVNGVLDLRDWNFKEDGPVDLKGEWKYVWMEDNPDFVLPEYNDSPWGIYPVPGIWRNLTGTNIGYGWIRLKIRVSSPEVLSLFIYDTIQSSYVLFIDGKESLKRGEPGNSKKTFKGDIRPGACTFTSKEDIVLALKMSNFSFVHQAGLEHTIKLGSLESLQSYYRYHYFIKTLVAGIILMMAISYLLVWIWINKNPTYFFYALLCINFFLFSIIFFLKSYLPFELYERITYSMFSCLCITLPSFFYNLFKEEFNRYVYLGFIVLGLLLTTIILFTPLVFFTRYLFILIIIELLLFIWISFVIVKAILNKKQEANIILGGFLFFFLSIILDIIFTFYLYSNIWLVPLGFIVLLFSHAAVLSIYFTRAVKRQEHLSNELEIAKRIQTSILPRRQTNDDFEIAAIMKTAEDVGGDYYDIMRDKENNLWFAIGDVSGHGVTPGLIMMMAQSCFASSLKTHTNISPKDIITWINSHIFENINNRLQVPHMMTMTLLQYLGEGRFLHAGAHLDLLVYKADRKECCLLKTSGVFLGFIPDISEVSHNSSFSLNIDDLLFLYTDGITEARHKTTGELWGEKRLMETITQNAGKEIEKIKDAVITGALAWCGQESNDDMTLVLLKRIT